MKIPCTGAILGDFNPAYPAHHALNVSARYLQQLLGEDIRFEWIGTEEAGSWAAQKPKDTRVCG